MRLTIERWANPLTRMVRSGVLVRLTGQSVVLSVSGEEAWFNRATGRGQRGAQGRKSLGGPAPGDWSGWALSAREAEAWRLSEGD